MKMMTSGAGRAHNCIVYLTFNHGFGGGTFLNGAALAGRYGNAGELSTIFDPDEIPHRSALGELIRRLKAKGISVDTVADLAATYDPAWPGAAEWIAETGPRLGPVLRALKAILDPGAIYFGGDAPPALRRQLIAAVAQAFQHHETPDPPILESGIEGDAAHLGAAFLPIYATVFMP